MSNLIEIIEKIQETHEAITRAERAIAKRPEDKSVTLKVKSLYNRQKNLEQTFNEIVGIEHLDVCSYRLIADEGERFSVSALSSTLRDFQKMITVIFDSVRNGPKIRATISAESEQLSSFDFAYAYPGSLGFVLTISNERLLLIESDMDNSMELAFKLAKANDSDQIYEMAQEIGIAAVRSVYKWSESHSQYGLSAEIQWKRQDEIRNSLLIQTPQLKRLKELIEATSDEEESRFEMRGKLVGLDTDLKTFHLKFPDAEDIKGKISDALDLQYPYKVPAYYTASLIKKIKVHFSYDKEDILYELISLKDKEEEGGNIQIEE